MMSAGVRTPFIPPLHTPAGHSPSSLPAPEPPVIPGHSPSAVPYPNWAAPPHHPGAFQISGGYPRTPYTSSTPYISGPSTLPPAISHPQASGAYVHFNSSYPPLLHRPVVPHPHDPGVSSDYIGYPSLPNSPATAPIAMQATPANSYHSMSLPAQGQAGSWGTRQSPGYPTMAQVQPMSAGSAYPTFQFSPHGPPPPNWAVPPPPHSHTPTAPYVMNLEHYATPHAATGTPWGPSVPLMQPPQFGLHAIPQPTQYHHPQLPQHIAGGVPGGTTPIADRMPPFAAGRSYGPVLEPFVLRVVRAKLRINPLLEPLPEDREEDRPHLKWTMLFKTNACQLSTDPGHVSWSKGRDEPATFPRVTKVNVVSETFPWVITVHASDVDIGVTCGEIIDGLSDDLHKLTSAADYESAPDGKRQRIGEAYRFNRSRAPGVPGGRLGDGLRKMDFLCRDVVFGGICQDERLVKRLIGEAVPATFVLRCMRQYALTQDELREHDARERAGEKKDAERRRRRVETVASDESTNSDDGLR